MEAGWHRTWDDDDEDYVYCDDKRNLGRVYIHDTDGITDGIVDGQWRWFFGASSGYADSRR